MMTYLETIPCEICGSEDFKPAYSKKDKFNIETQPFQVGSCGQCGFVYINPRPSISEIGKFYPEHYQFKEGKEEAPGFAARLEKAYRHHQLQTEIARMKKYIWKYPARILDIGSGTGDRLELFKKAGCEVYGVESSEQAIYAQKHFNVPVFRTIEEGAFPDNHFDIITMYNVLEHVHQPRAVLKEIRRIIKQGGVLVLEVPNNRSWQAKWFGSRWAAVDVPRDLYYYNVETLTRLLGECGLQVQTIDYKTNFWHPPTMVISLFPWLDPQLIWAQDARQQSGLLKRVLWGILTLVLAPIPFLEGLFRRGALMTLFVSQNTAKEMQ